MMSQVAAKGCALVFYTYTSHGPELQGDISDVISMLTLRERERELNSSQIQETIFDNQRLMPWLPKVEPCVVNAILKD